MNKLIYGGIFLASVGFFTASCKKQQFEPSDLNSNGSTPSSKAIISEEGSTILGNRLTNPFTTQNMSNAYLSLGGADGIIQTNHLYVRFLVTSPDIALSLEEKGLILSSTPLDYEVLEYGTHYNDPTLQGKIWFYSTVDLNFDLNQYQHEIIDELFLPALLIGSPKYDAVFTSFDHEALIDQAMIKAGYDESGEKAATKYRPKGYIRVQQKIASSVSNVPVKNIKVRTRWWFDYGTGYTNDNGYFEANETYRKNRKVEIKCIFENQYANIRAVKGLQFWDIFFTERKVIGDYQNSAMESINYVFQNSADIASDTKRKWMACHALNALREHHVYCSQNGVLAPNNGLNIWLTNANANGNSLSTYAAAPMLKQMSNSSILTNTVQLLLVATGHPWFAIAYQVLEQFPPDVTYNYSQNSSYNTNSDKIAQIFFHEFSHASHYRKVGNSYWASYITYIVQHNGYGSSSTSGSGRIAVSEAWAEFCSARFAHLRYGNNNSSPSSFSSWLSYIEGTVGSSSDPWIPDGVMHDITDVGEPTFTGVVDAVSGYSISNCFNAMDSDIITVRGYRDRFISENPSVSTNDMNKLFVSYGY